MSTATARDVASVVRDAQSEMDRAIHLAQLTDDPLRHFLEALSSMLGAIHEVQTTASADAEARFSRIADQITAAAVQERDAAKAVAAEAISRAGDWAARRMQEAADEAARKAFQRISDETNRAEAASRASHRASTFAIMSAVLAAACAAGWFAVPIMSFLH